MKVPEPRKLKSGNYFIQLRLNGVSIPITAGSAKDCKQQAILAKAEYLAGKREVRREDMTLGSLIDDYIDKYETVLSPSTIRGYSSARKNRFQDYMDKPIRDIKDWQAMINKELGKVSVKTVMNGWGIVTAAMTDIGFSIPNITMPDPPENELSFLEPEEIPLFLEAARGDSAEVEMLLELHGLRESEVMRVVRNNQFDLKHDLILVRGAMVPNKDNKYVEKDTNKTRASTRDVPIMIPRLKELLSEPFEVHSASTLLSHVHKTCKRAGITDVTNHGLRRTFASLGYSLGLSERVIMDLGGWDNPETVHKIYIKLTKRDKEKAKNAMTEFYRQKSEAELLNEALNKLKDIQEKYSSIAALNSVFKAIDKLVNANENANVYEKSA